MAFNISRAVMSPIPQPLPRLGQLAEFSLTDQEGKPFGSRELRGKVWVANFIFTRCQTVCPAFTAKMAQIRHRSRGLGTAFHHVSFTVDPEHDTPEVLKKYALEHRAQVHSWSFLTGSLEDLKETVTQGLKIAFGPESTEGNFAGIFHGSHFVLVDTEGQIRGYYAASDSDAVDRILADAAQLLNFGR